MVVEIISAHALASLKPSFHAPMQGFGDPESEESPEGCWTVGQVDVGNGPHGKMRSYMGKLGF